MTGREKAFVMEYVYGMRHNQTAAAIKAGYAEKSARHAASRLMKKYEIQQAIADMLQERRAYRIAIVNELLEFLTAVIRGEAVDRVEMCNGNGEKICVPAAASVRDRLKAAELLGKYYGMFENRQTTTGGGVIILSVIE